MKMVPLRKELRPSIDRDWRETLIAIHDGVLAAGSDVAAMMQSVTDGALAILPQADGATIVLHEDGHAICRAGSGTGATQIGRVVARTPDTEDRTPLRAFIDRRGSRSSAPVDGGDTASLIVVPLPHHGRAAGFLNVTARKPDAFRDDDLLMMQLLAGPVAIGLGSLAEAQAEQARHRAVTRFEATFDHAAVGIAHVAIDGRFLLVNQRFSDIVGHDQAALLARGFQAITHPDDLQLDLDLVADLIEGRTKSYSMEKRYVRLDGELVWVNLTVSLVRDAQGQPDFFVSVIQDLTEMRIAKADAVHDPLTGLLNRRGLVGHLSAIIRDGLADQSVIVAYIDLDGFKTVNDRFGHAEGDRCLIALGERIRATVRPGDAVARMGGDEFVLIMPVPPFAEATEILERVRCGISQDAGETGWSVTASIGAICVPLHWNRTAEEMVATADAAMYRAKTAGKDRVVLIRA